MSIASPTPLVSIRTSVRTRIVVSALLLLFLTLTISYALTRCPWWDEGLFSDVAATLHRSGHLGSSVLAPYAFMNMPAVDQYTYWQFPVYLLSLSAWFNLFPATYLSARLFSAVCGCAFVGCWFLFARAMTRNTTLALWIACLVALDHATLYGASNGRMDIMCAALGQAALASYACLRDSHPRRALALTGLLGAASLFCHPMGAVTNAFILLLLISDWRRFRWSTFSLLLPPYFVGAALCFAYTRLDPDLFVAQSKSVSGYRIRGVFEVLAGIAKDSRYRYWSFYFPPHAGLDRVKIFSLLFGLIGIAALTLDSKRRSEPFTKLLFAFVCVAYVGVAAIDNQRFHFYLIYVTPILSAAGAAWTYYAFRNRSGVRFLAGFLLGACVLVNVANCIVYIRRNAVATEYNPVLAIIRHTAKPGDIVMAPSEFGFALGFGRPVVDDCFLGFVSGIQPRIYVSGDVCAPPLGSTFRWKWSKRVLASEYRLVLKNRSYTVYLRKGPAT